jgi:hypothetical protein
MNGEFRMITDLSTAAPKELLFNYDELKAFLTEELQVYKSLVVTEDGIADAKAKRAKLNKLADNINSYRINVKNQLMAQYDKDFKPKCDELVSMTKEASDNISNQIKAYEQNEKEEKTNRLYAEWVTYADGELAAYCPWNIVYNDRWSNKTYPIDDAIEEIKASLERTKGDLAAIRDMGGDDTPALLQWYAQTHDLSAVVRKASELATMRQREEQRKREAEERRAADEEKPKIEPQIASASATTGNLVTVDFRVVCTREQLTALGQYMKANGIKYGRP